MYTLYSVDVFTISGKVINKTFRTLNEALLFEGECKTNESVLYTELEEDKVNFSIPDETLSQPVVEQVA